MYVLRARRDGKPFGHVFSNVIIPSLREASEIARREMDKHPDISVDVYAIQQVMPEPRGFETWNPAMQGAYRRGFGAARAGLPADACPYEDKRKSSGRLTWSRAFIAAWRDGHLAGTTP